MHVVKKILLGLLVLVVVIVGAGIALSLFSKDPIDTVAETNPQLASQAKAGDAQAQYDVGVLFYNAEGVKQDLWAARNWFEKAAEQGHNDAQRILGVMFWQGHGTAKNTQRAIEWLDKAAAGQNGKAMFNLGFIYHTGDGVDRNPARAALWFGKACEQEVRAACRLQKEAQALLEDAGAGSTQKGASSNAVAIQPDSDAAEMQLKGSVKSIKTAETAIQSPDEDPFKDAFEANKGSDYFNEKGFLTHQEQTRSTSAGQQQLVTQFALGGTVNRLIRLSSSTTIDGQPASSHLYVYDDDGRLSARHLRNADELIVESTLYEYDEQGRLVDVSNYIDSKTIKPQHRYRYNEAGQVVEKVVLEEGKQSHRRTFVYNPEGLLIEESLFAPSANEPLQTSRYQYVFDDRGNWVRRLASILEAGADTPRLVLRAREIEYFD